MSALTAEIRARMEKVRALMDSPNPGEAAAARARYVEMQAKYGPAPEPQPIWRQELSESLRRHRQERGSQIVELTIRALRDLEAKGYFAQGIDGEWLISPADDLAHIIARGRDPIDLIAAAAQLIIISEGRA